MSKQANTKIIGAFVVGAVALTIVGVFLFGSGKFFQKNKQFVLFFEDSVEGLTIGAPVDFRGVKVGTVTDIKIIVEPKDLSLHIPVFMEIDPDKLHIAGPEAERVKALRLEGTKTFVQLMIERGLRAQLAMQSLVTGQLGIHMDFYPDKPLRLVGTEPEYKEIPTIQSSLSELAKTLQNIPIQEIVDKFEKTLDGVEKLVNSPDLMETVVSLHKTVDEAHKLLKDVDGQVKPLAGTTGQTLDEAKKMFAYAAQLARTLEERTPQLLASLEGTSKQADTTLKGANRAIEGLAGDESPVRVDLIRALNEFASAARSIRVLSQYLENHPETIIRGKEK